MNFGKAFARTLAGVAALCCGALSASPRAWLIQEEGGKILSQAQVHSRLPMASLTKIGTSLFALERLRADDWVAVRETVRMRNATDKSAPLVAGEHYRMRDVAACMLISSTNQAARSTGAQISGSESAFVRDLNQWAARNALRETVFADSPGLSPQSVSSVSDISRMLDLAQRNAEIARILEADRWTMTEQGGRRVDLSHTLAFRSHGAFRIYGKTGNTSAAGFCFAGFARRAKSLYRIVILGSADLEADLKAFLDHI